MHFQKKNILGFCAAIVFIFLGLYKIYDNYQSNQATFYYQKGKRAQYNKKYEEAKKYYRYVIEKFGPSKDVYLKSKVKFHEIQLHNQEVKPKQLYEEYFKTKFGKRDHPLIHYLKSLIYIDLGKSSKALELISQLVQIHPFLIVRYNNTPDFLLRDKLSTKERLLFNNLLNVEQQYDEKIMKKFEEARLQLAENESKLILLNFYADWCPDCHVFKETINDEHIQKIIQDKYIMVDIDVGRFDKNLFFIKQYSIVGVTTLVIVDEDGKEVDRTFFNPATDLTREDEKPKEFLEKFLGK